MSTISGAMLENMLTGCTVSIVSVTGGVVSDICLSNRFCSSQKEISKAGEDVTRRKSTDISL